MRIVQNIRMSGDGPIAGAIAEPPKVNVEGIEKLAEQFPTVGDANAKPLTVEGPSGDRAAGDGRRGGRSRLALREGHRPDRRPPVPPRRTASSRRRRSGS